MVMNTNMSQFDEEQSVEGGAGSIAKPVHWIPKKRVLKKKVSAICLLLNRQLPPKPQIPCFCGFVFWRQCDSVLITVLEHERKEERDRDRDGMREEERKHKPEH